MDKYQELAVLLSNPSKANEIISESVEQTQANLKANGLDFSIEELKALAEKATIQQTQGELSEDALDQVAGGFVSSHTAVVGFVARHIGYISKWLRR